MLCLISGYVFENPIKKVWGRRLEDTAEERRPPNGARRKHVPQTLDTAPFGNALGDVAGDALTIECSED
jgi:hypothetical protein